MYKINMGCGSDIRSGWLNIDMLDQSAPNYMKWDLNKGLPTILDAEVSTLYSAHCLEHFSFKRGQKILKSCYETLRSGGVIRLCLPDFRKLAGAYLSNNWEFFNHPQIMHFAPNKQFMEIMNYAAYQRDPNTDINEHCCLYDSAYAIFALERVGFKDCKEVEFDPEFDQDLELRRKYSFYVTGKKN